MKKRKVIFFSIFLLIVVVAFLYFSHEVTICGNVFFSEKIAKKAAEKKDISLCGDIVGLSKCSFIPFHPPVSSKEMRVRCYVDAAGLLDQVNLCDNVFEMESLSSSEKIHFTTQCVRQIAEQRGDPSICESSYSEKGRGECYMQMIILELSDASICETIKNADGRDSCYDGASMRYDNIHFCTQIVDYQHRSSCYRRRGGCEEFESQEAKDFCYGDQSAARENLRDELNILIAEGKITMSPPPSEF